MTSVESRTNDRLIRRLIDDDDAARGELLEQHRRDAFNLARRFLRRPEDAADAVQEAFLRALRAMQGSTAAPQEPDRIRPWLLRIVSNVALDHLRRERRKPVGSLDDVEEQLIDADWREPPAVAERGEERSQVLRALLALPTSQRAALTLREFQELSYDEIGEQLGLNRTATTMLLYRARVSFRQAYEGATATTRTAGCPELAPLLSAMLDDELEPPTWNEIDQHLETCGRCQRELKGLRRSRRLYAAIPFLAPPAGWCYATLAAPATVEAASRLGTLAPVAAEAAGLATVGAALPSVAAPVAGLGWLSGLGSAATAMATLAASKTTAVAAGLAITVAVSLAPDASTTDHSLGSDVPASSRTLDNQPSSTAATPVWDTSDVLTATIPTAPSSGVGPGPGAGTGADEQPTAAPPMGHETTSLKAPVTATAVPPSKAPVGPLVAADAADRAETAARAQAAEPQASTQTISSGPRGQVTEPPGQAMKNPGQDNVPPGQAAKSAEPDQAPPGHIKAPPGQARTANGAVNAPPGHADTPPGQSDSAPGHASTPPGQRTVPPGQQEHGADVGRSRQSSPAVSAPGQSSDPPGNADGLPNAPQHQPAPAAPPNTGHSQTGAAPTPVQPSPPKPAKAPPAQSSPANAPKPPASSAQQGPKSPPPKPSTPATQPHAQPPAASSPPSARPGSPKPPAPSQPAKPSRKR